MVLTIVFFASLMFLIVLLSTVFAAPRDCCKEQCVATDPPICNGVTVNICDYCDVNKYFYYRCSQVSCVKTCTDADKDGYGKAGSTGCTKTGVDCNDANAAVHPGATEVCGNGVDEDCAGGDLACTPTCTDADKDGYGKAGSTGCTKTGVDCNDSNAAVHPGGVEICGNGVDEDCSGADLVCAPKCIDTDKDGYGTSGSTGCSKTGTDCNDSNAAINPGATEICGNGVDEDCSGADLACAPKLTVSISQPTTFEFLAGNYVTFSAAAFGGSYPYKLSWQSDLDGALYSGYNNYYSTNKLSLGSHSINLSVTDNLGITANKTLNVAIKATSSLFAVISSPYSSDQFPVGTPVYFNSMVSGAKSPATYTWTSDKDGVISTSNFFSISTLSLGDHKITLTVTDAAANTIVNSINIKIISGMVLKIYQPIPGSYEQGTNIFFNANTTGGTSPYTFTWSSDKDGLISGGGGGGTFGSGFMKSDLSLGTHLIAVLVTDAVGAKVSQSLALEIIKPQCFDDDKDGYGKVRSSACTTSQADCEDTNPSINPAATEICPNTVDENCNGSITDCPVTLTVLSPASDGMTFAWGSKFNIKIKGTPIVSASVSIYDSADKFVGYATLFDDGTHNDGVAGDDIWGVDAPLVYPDGNYYLNANVNTLPHKKIRTFSINNMPTCTTLVNNGSSADKLDIVFIADQYTAAEMPNFVKKVQSAYTHLLGLKPFDTQNTKINIHRVDSPVNMGCADWGTAQPNCSATNISTIAKLCPSDRVIVVADGTYRSFAYFGGYANVAANGSNFEGVVAHEFGHSFGLLHDEYTDSSVPDPGTGSVNLSVNCDTSSVCAKWSTTTGAGCFIGCDYRNTYYRSISNGKMKDSSISVTDYGVVNINQLNKLFTSYK